MQVLIPISGRSNFFPEEEFYFPKPLIEVAGRPMIELVIDQLKSSLPSACFTFVINREDAQFFSIDRTLVLTAGKETKVIERQAHTAGALCSCLLSVEALDLDQPLLVANSDQIIDADIGVSLKEFEALGYDAGVITFDSVHPRWSYIVPDADGNVLQACEKKVVSRQAIAGLYWFRSARKFLEAGQRAILKDAHVQGNFYISASLNEMILMGERVTFSQIDVGRFHSFYMPSRIEAFEHTQLAASLRQGAGGDGPALNVIIPAAGEGSRFSKAGWKRPKPFIDVQGCPMLLHVIRNVIPAGADTTLLLRKSHIDAHPDITAKLQASGAGIVPVDRLTEGTACTVLLARHVYDNDRPMMVANSDQLVDFDVSDFVRDCKDRSLDGSILVFRDPSRNPKWSFARTNVEGLVVEVAEKNPISDLATVGIYLFARGRDFVGAAADMIALNDRVNSEFYTCPVYNHMIRNGAKIGVYEVPRQAMRGLGTPEDLTDYLSSVGAPTSEDQPSSL